MTQPELEDRLAVLLGGRAAEEIIYDGVISTGAADDLEKVSELVRLMVTRFGMSTQLGQLTYGKSQAGRFLSLPGLPEERNYSERTAQEIDDEVRRLIREIYARVKKLLEGRRTDLETVAQELMRKESLDEEDLERLLAHAKPQR